MKTIIFKSKEARPTNKKGNYSIVNLAPETFNLIKGDVKTAIVPCVNISKQDVDGIESYVKAYPEFDKFFFSTQSIAKIIKEGVESNVFGPTTYWMKTSDITPDIEIDGVLPTDF